MFKPLKLFNIFIFEYNPHNINFFRIVYRSLNSLSKFTGANYNSIFFILLFRVIRSYNYRKTKLQFQSSKFPVFQGFSLSFLGTVFPCGKFVTLSILLHVNSFSSGSNLVSFSWLIKSFLGLVVTIINNLPSLNASFEFSESFGLILD